MPAYLRSTHFQNPEEPANRPFQYANKCGRAFSWLPENPEVFQAFHKYVHALRIRLPSWTDVYPVEERLVKGVRAEGDAPVFVDVGGVMGQILQDFRAGVPQYTGRLVLQELDAAVSAADAAGVGEGGSGIELQVHECFTSQPVKGAHAYYMCSVLHN